MFQRFDKGIGTRVIIGLADLYSLHFLQRSLLLSLSQSGIELGASQVPGGQGAAEPPPLPAVGQPVREELAPPKAPPTKTSLAKSPAANSPSPGRVLPPPPPPTVAGSFPARPTASSGTANTAKKGAGPGSAPASGVGSARGVFWRDEMPVAAAEGEEEERELRVEREAPAWLVSLVLHLLGMLILALIATPYGQRMTSIVLEMGAATEQGDDLETFELDATSPEISDALPEVADPVIAEPIEMPMEVFSPDSLIETVTPVPASIDKVALATSGMLSGRSGASKEALLAAFGGTAETEEAVQLGLAWLAKNQESEGSWSLRGPYDDGSLSENRLAATAMAMLAFQGNGNTHMSGPYKSNVERAVRWLVKTQERDGFMAKGLERHHQMYAQGQATIALCELYAMTGDSWLRDPAQRALNFAMESQSSMGGWRYVPRQDADTSVTGWFVMALFSGKAAGLEVSDSVLRNVGYFLDSVQHYDGAAYSYQRNGGPSEAMTAEGMLCRQYLGWTRDSVAMTRCVNSLVDQYSFDIEDGHYYYWYYATQVLHHYGGSQWRLWNEKMRVQLPAAQVRQGSERGSWSPQGSRWGGQGGRLYTTCLAIYCLEVYYRHMPLYDIEVK